MEIFVGCDHGELLAYQVTVRSCIKNSRRNISDRIHALYEPHLRGLGLYNRSHRSIRGGGLYDDISEAPMSTSFAISRFLTPLVSSERWSLFMDGDMLIRGDLQDLQDRLDPKFAVMCVKHNHEVSGDEYKKRGNAFLQTKYNRKNWSSVMAFNRDHPSNLWLTMERVNLLPGRDLHAFCWLKDDEIGDLPVEWNWLEGVMKPIKNPKLVHYTTGTPDAIERKTAYSDEWWAIAKSIQDG